MSPRPPRSRNRPAQPRPWEHIPDVFGNVEDISDALITREGQEFMVTDAVGQVPPGNNRGLGLYARDTRHLSVYELLMDGQHPFVLLSTADSGYGQEQVLGNRRFTLNENIVGRCTVEVARQRLISDGLHEHVQVTNHNRFAVSIRLTYRFDADFADLFEVRGHQREHPGEHLPANVKARSISYRYLGADGVWRSTVVSFDRTPDEIDERGATLSLHLKPRQKIEYSIHIGLNESPHKEARPPQQRLREAYDDWRSSFSRIRTNNEVFDQVIARSLSDLRMLWTRDSQGHDYVAAGTPWFATLFGRDSINSLQTLPFQPAIARGCLALLARLQGQNVDSFYAEEPGKILHEARDDELCMIKELPYGRYYGSVDSTPLFLILAAEYFHWTADLEYIRSLLPAIEGALRWLREYADLDGDGLIEHRTDSPDGLRNQGWKDSVEAIVHADGSLLEGPITLAEVQGYVFLAYTRLAPVLEALGQVQRARELKLAAHQLRRRFVSAFWLPESKRIALALDGHKRPADVMSSNAGQVLWSGIIDHTKADHVRRELFSQSMFSGWGLRTLSSEAMGYYPLGYHLGTIWPHDNGIIAMGLKRYGFRDEVNEIATSLFDAARAFPAYRLPELFGGQPRGEFQPPVPYPVACRPQAWTAGAFLHLLQAMLGLHPDASNQRLYVIRPDLPFWLQEVEIEDLRVGEARVSLSFRRQRGSVRVDQHVEGNLSVVHGQTYPRTTGAYALTK